MIFKYYSFNVTSGGGDVVGSRVIRVPFFHSPLSAMNAALREIEPSKSIIDFKRVE